jgi:EmrB/QacA subfamily drug resistance transporter
LQTATRSDRWRWVAFAAALVAILMDLLDSTIANVAAPTIRADLGGSYSDLQWISASYTLAMAVMLLCGGRLSDIFGRKRMLLVGAAGFTAASAACALAPSAGLLIVFRALQGGLGAVMVPQVFGLIRDLFAPQEMGKAFGVLGPACGMAAILGPIVSGLLIDVDPFGTDWRSIFLVNLPAGAFVLVAGARLLPDVAPTVRSRRLDLTGIALAATGAFLLVYPLVQGRDLGWPAPVKAMMAASVAVFAVFAVHQLRRARAGAPSLIEPSVFAHRSYVSGIAFAVVFLGAMGAITIITGVLLQVGLGYSPIHASLTMLPFAVGGTIGSASGATMVHRVGQTILQAGLALMGAGMVAMVVVLHHAGAGVESLDLIAPLLVAGIGMGMVWVPLLEVVIADVGDHEVGSASGVLQAVQQLGRSLGIAAIGTMFFGMVGGGAGRTGDFVDAAQTTTLVTVGLIAAAFAIAFLLPRRARTQHAPAGGAWSADAEAALA